MSSVMRDLCLILNEIFLGSVLYFMNDKHQVIGLLKKKTIWYVILRAIREKARHMLTNWEKQKAQPTDLAETIARTVSRLNAIQRWLQFADVILDRWKILAKQYLTWLMDEAKKKTIQRNDIADTYPMLWLKFLEENHYEDNFMIEFMPSTNLVNEDVWKQLNSLVLDENEDMSTQDKE
jgi:hypothetical protein